MMTIRLNPADLTTTRADLGLVIGTDVLAPNGSAASLTNMPGDLSGDLRNIALGSAADRITLLNGIVDPLTDETDVNSVAASEEGGSAVTGNTHGSDSAFVAQRFTASISGTVTGVKFNVAGIAQAAGVDYRIETSDGSTTPTGVLVDSNAVLTTSTAYALGAATVYHTENFPSSFNIVAGTEYWIVISRNTTTMFGIYRLTAGTAGQPAGGLITGTGYADASTFHADRELGIKVLIAAPADASVNQNFTAGGGGFYTGKAQAEVNYSGSANIGNMTFAGGLAAAFDGTTSQAMSAAATSNTGANTASAFVGKDWGSGNTKTITGVKVYASSDQGYIDGTGSSVTIDVLGSNTTPSNSGDGTVLATVVSAMTDSTAQQEKLTGFTETAFRFVWVRITPNTSCVMSFAEIEFFETNTLNMTLVSTAFTATSAPTKTVLGFQTIETGTVTINTDLKGFVSRDGGANYTSVSLVLKSTLGQTGTKYYECLETALTSTSGSSLVYKITTHNTKDIQIHGVALSWS
jgi:hypothetical protein